MVDILPILQGGHWHSFYPGYNATICLLVASNGVFTPEQDNDKTRQDRDVLLVGYSHCVKRSDQEDDDKTN